MKRMKKILGAALAAAMSVSLLAGCGSGSSGNSSSSGGSSSSAASSSDKGRYVETVVENAFPDFAGSGEVQETGETDGEGHTHASYQYSISTIAPLKDGTLRALVTDGTSVYKIYSSADGGKTWEDTKADFSGLGKLGYEESSDEEGAGSSRSISSVSFDGDGNLFFDLSEYSYKENSSDETHHYYIMTADGKCSEADIEIPNIPKTQHYDYDEEYGEDMMGETDLAEPESEDDIVISESGENGDEPADDYYYSGSLSSVKLVDPGHLYAASDNSLYLISLEDGKVLQTITDLDYISGMAVCGDQLVATSYDKTFSYDLATGEKKKENEDLANIMTSARGNFLLSDNYGDKPELYYCDSDGIFRYSIETGEITQVVDGALTSLIDPNMYCSAFVSCGGETFLTAAEGSDGNNLLYYAYDPDMPARPEKSLRVYALTDNYTLRQAVAGYQKSHGDTYVSYEWGMTGEDAVTVSDAMRTLNTEIMGGNGPDVILLDGLSVENYINKGVLADVSDVVQPLIDDGKLFANQASAFKNEQGQITAVPMTFAYPMMIGDKDMIDGVKTLADLADKAEAFAKSNDNKNVRLMESYSLSMLPMAVLPVCSSWYGKDGSLNVDEMKSDLENIRRIYAAAYSTLSDEDKKNADSMNEYYTSEDAVDMDISSGSWVSDPSNDALYISSGVNKVGLGYLQSSDSLSNITSAMRVDKELTYTSMPGSDGAIYVPNNILGVSAKSNDIETAKSFLSYMLGDSSQKTYAQLYSGFPISKTVFDSIFVNPYEGEDWYDPKEPLSGMGMTDEKGNEFTLNIFWPTQEEIDAFKESVSRLDTASSKNNLVMNTIFRDALPYITGSGELEDTVDKIQKDIKIYLSE